MIFNEKDFHSYCQRRKAKYSKETMKRFFRVNKFQHENVGEVLYEIYWLLSQILKENRDQKDRDTKYRAKLVRLLITQQLEENHGD